jgi:hypothetical protein
LDDNVYVFCSSLPDLLRTFGLTLCDVSGEVRSLVTTFTLGANNITFKPPEWSFLGLIIIKMYVHCFLVILDTSFLHYLLPVLNILKENMRLSNWGIQ